MARPDFVSNFKQKVFVSKPVSKFLVSFHVKPRVEYYVSESNHASKFKEKDFKRFPSYLTQKLFTLNLTRDPLEFTKKPGGPKIIPTIFLTADNVAAAKKIVGIIFGPPGFFVNSNGSVK